MIIRTINAHDMPEFRRLLAAEGYADLGMFQEAEAELRELDPAWFAFKEIISLQLRVVAGLTPRE
jgi:hypothetical protein